MTLLLALLLASAAAISPASTSSPWQSPLDRPLRVERPFLAPAEAWGPGHRGVDLEARPGDVVRSAGAGRVVHAGFLAGRWVVSVQHSTGWRTTYEGVRPIVAEGDAVTRGQRIGSMHLVGTHCTCLHWGLRKGTTYADPMGLLRRPVVLKPRSVAPAVD